MMDLSEGESESEVSKGREEKDVTGELDGN